MADYIYLMQNRLTPAQWRALEAVREAARTQNMPVFLVGGAVRDLTSGAPVRDLDFAVQGEARSLVKDLEGRGAIVAGENPVLSSTYWTFRGGVRVEIGPTLSISYPKPGKPEARTAAILDDLRRRDFTANAMAVSLNEGSYGLLLDPLNGTADIENRELRLVSPYGFIEQPAFLLRAARLSDRLGWSLEEKTQGRYKTSKEEEHIKALSDWDRSYELEEIFHEEDPVAMLDHMEAEGWRGVLFPAVDGAQADRSGMDEVRDLIGQLESLRLYPDPSAVYFPLITAKLSEENRTTLKESFARQGFTRQIETLETRSKELANQLTAKSTPMPSDAWKLLTDADPEVVLWLAYHSRSSAVQSRIKAFLKEWPQMRQKVPYALMQEMRITPELPGYEQLLDDLFFASIDGKLDTPEAMRAFLEPFSPPASPQVSVRRRPAKSARGRGKRAAEPVASEPEKPDETEDDDEDEAETEADENVAELRLPPPIPLSQMGRETNAPDEADEESETGAELEEIFSSDTPEESEVVPPAPEITPVTPEPPRVPEPPVAAHEPTPKAASTAKPVRAAAKLASKTVAKTAAPAKIAGVAKAVPAKSSAAKKGEAAATGHPGAKAGKDSPPSKALVKAVSAVKPGTKVVPAKKTAMKLPVKAAKPAAKKTTPVKVVTKTGSVKTAAKKQPVKGKAAAPGKVATPAKSVKASKKSAVKGRGGR